MVSLSSDLIGLCEDIADKPETEDIVEAPIVGVLLDTRNTNKDFRRFAGRVRRIVDETSVFVEYVDGEIKEYRIKDGYKIFSLPDLNRFISKLKENVELGALSKEDVSGMITRLERWKKIYKKQ